VSAHDADIKSQAERVQDLSTPSLSYNTKKQLDRFANVCTDPADAHLIKQAKLLIHLCTEAPATNMQGQLKILQLLCERHRDIRMHALASVFEDIRAQSRSDGHARRDIIHKFAVQLHMVCTTEHNLADIQQEAQQLLTLCVESNQVERLYKNYMDLKELKVAKQAAESGIRGSGDDQTNFAFVSDDYTLLLSRKNIHDMLHMHPGHDWDQVCLYKGDELDTEMGLKEVYERFSLFNNAYQYMLNAATFAKLLKTMNLNFTAKHVEAYELEQKEYQENVQEPENEKDQDNSGVIILKPRDYAPLFMSAIAQGKSTVKLVELADQEALWRLFQPLLSKERGEGQTATVISPDHADQILDIYEITDASARDQAMHFFCLAYLFAYYSSAHVFGIERNSPYALRLYAAGLLYKARELDPTIFIDQSGDDKFDYYIKELTKPSFGCTAVLSNNHMRPLIISNGGNAILIKIKPPGFA
jgi:hypothetical protein